MLNLKEQKRIYRHRRTRKTVTGLPNRPRLCVHRSLKNLRVQVIDDTTGKVLFGKSTLAKDVRGKAAYGGNVKAAELLGEALAQEALKRGIQQVAFDRGGYPYHGRIKALAEAARKNGLQF